jgi:hypothetical protein
LLDHGLVSGQCFVPEALELCAKGSESFWIDFVYALLALTTRDDEAGLAQYLEVLRYRRPADWQVNRERVDGSWLVEKAFEDRSPRRIA